MQRTAPALDDDDVGSIVPENDVEEGPSVVRVDATPSTADSDDVGFGVRQLDKLGNNQLMVLRSSVQGMRKKVTPIILLGLTCWRGNWCLSSGRTCADSCSCRDA